MKNILLTKKDLYYFFLLEKRVFLRLKRTFLYNVKQVWKDSTKNFLLKLFYICVHIQLFLVKFSLFLFMHIYYIFLHSIFGQISFLLMLPIIFGSVEIGFPYFFLFYFCLIMDALSIYFLCRIFPQFEQWIYNCFGYNLVRILCGNTPMRSGLRALGTFGGYYILRTTDSVINDWRIDSVSNKEAEYLKHHHKVDSLPLEKLEEIREKATNRIAPGVVHKFENVMTSVGSEIFKSIGEGMKK
jgi:hypothetical protein